MTVIDSHHPTRNARASLAYNVLLKRVFRCNFLIYVSEYDLQMLSTAMAIVYQPNDVVPSCNIRTFTTLVDAYREAYDTTLPPNIM